MLASIGAAVKSIWRHSSPENGFHNSALIDAGRPGPIIRSNMKTLSIFKALVKDEQGGEVLEYALIAGLIVVAAIATIAGVGTKVVARWTSVNASM
jgi:Flp pilus assembly pilin Flp